MNNQNDFIDLPLINVEDYNDHDVLCGRGGAINSHIGNYTFRHLILLNKNKYFFSSKEKKTEIAYSLVSAIRNQIPPGRFLKKDSLSGLWSDIGDLKAIEKTRQALRETPSKKRRSSSESDISISMEHIKKIESLFAKSENSKNFVPYFPNQEEILKSEKKEQKERSTLKGGKNYSREKMNTLNQPSLETRIVFQDKSMMYKCQEKVEKVFSNTIFNETNKNIATSLIPNLCEAVKSAGAQYTLKMNLSQEVSLEKRDYSNGEYLRKLKPSIPKHKSMQQSEIMAIDDDFTCSSMEEDYILAQNIVETSFQENISEHVQDEEIDRLIYQTFAGENILSEVEEEDVNCISSSQNISQKPHQYYNVMCNNSALSNSYRNNISSMKRSIFDCKEEVCNSNENHFRNDFWNYDKFEELNNQERNWFGNRSA